MYTPIPKEKGLSNICKILARGGEAIITSHPTGKSGGRMISLDFGESKMKHRVKQFFAANPSLQAVEYVFPAMQQGFLFNNSTLRIRRGIPFKKKRKIMDTKLRNAITEKPIENRTKRKKYIFLDHRMFNELGILGCIATKTGFILFAFSDNGFCFPQYLCSNDSLRAILRTPGIHSRNN